MKNSYGQLEPKYITLIIISLIIGAAILGYGYLNYKYHSDALKAQNQLEQQKQAEKLINNLQKNEQAAQNKKKLQECLNDIDSRVKEFAEANKDITLNTDEAKTLADIISQQKEQCINLYSQE